MYEGMTVDEILGEVAIVGDASLSMTTEIPGQNGETMYLPKTVNCRCIVILPGAQNE